jgi:hypothetical protein
VSSGVHHRVCGYISFIKTMSALLTGTVQYLHGIAITNDLVNYETYPRPPYWKQP